MKLQKWSTEKNERQLLRKQQKTNQINTIFSVAVADAEDNVTQQLAYPDNNNSNLICGAEFALESKNTCLNPLRKLTV